MDNAPIICADVIARHGDSFVLIQRKTNPIGLALPGGKHDPGETLSETAIRELYEETQLELTIQHTMGVYAHQGRDPRGNYISVVFIGVAVGTPKPETCKTEVLLLSQDEIILRSSELVFDHSQILTDYLKGDCDGN